MAERRYPLRGCRRTPWDACGEPPPGPEVRRHFRREPFATPLRRLARGPLPATSWEIYTDVPGVLSADPRCVPRARVLPLIEPSTALTLTALGAGVLMFRAASLGYSRGIPIVVRSAFDEGPGTRIDSEV